MNIIIWKLKKLENSYWLNFPIGKFQLNFLKKNQYFMLMAKHWKHNTEIYQFCTL
jgi:hypothetical protein